MSYAIRLTALAVLLLAAPASGQVAFDRTGDELPNPVDEEPGVLEFTLSNTSGAPVDWTSVSITNAGIATVTVEEPSAFPVTIPDGGSATLRLRFGFGDVDADVTAVTSYNDATVTIDGYNPATNGIYEIYAGTLLYGNAGTYTFRTGPDHPFADAFAEELDGRSDLLYGEGFPGTSFDTVRSYLTKTDYVLGVRRTATTPGFTAVGVGDVVTVTAVDDPAHGEVGFDGVFRLRDGDLAGAVKDDLTITRRLRVRGTTFDDSHVEVTTIVANDGPIDLPVGIRYLWDYQIYDGDVGEFDDGTTFRAFRPDGVTLVAEMDFGRPAFAFYGQADGEDAEDEPTLFVFGTVSGPALEPQPPVPPDLVQYVSWPDAFGKAFTYETAGLDVASSDGEIDDSAVTYTWGPVTATAIVIPPGGSLLVSQSIFASLPEDTPDEVIADPRIAVTPLSIDFGAVRVGASRDRTVTVTNTGTGALNIAAIEMSGAEFVSLDAGDLPIQVPEGDSIQLTLRFAPSAVGPFSGTARITSDSADSAVPAVALTGAGTDAPARRAGLEGGGCAARPLGAAPDWRALEALSLAGAFAWCAVRGLRRGSGRRAR